MLRVGSRLPRSCLAPNLETLNPRHPTPHDLTSDSLNPVSTILIVLGAGLIIAGLASTFAIIMDAFDNELYRGLLCLVFFPYMIWYAFAEFDHERKWWMVGAWMFGTSLGTLLLGMGLAGRS